MNSMIEILNQRGENFFHFAGPMLWQSSLLIALVFLLDFLLARKIRAAVRYALWLAVLVKLILPPALALPTSAAWWLIPVKPVMHASVAKKFVISYDNPLPPADFDPQIAVPAPSALKLTGAGRALLVSGCASVSLLLFLGFRWWQVNQMVRRATASEELSEIV